MMPTASYIERRGEIENYFDRTALDAWTKLTSDVPLGRIRRTVRAGREEMRRTLLDWLPIDLSGKRLLDAGCGTGALAIEAARRGADVVAVDLSQQLVELASTRAPRKLGAGSVEFRVGDMLSPSLGQFDYAVAMDSLIHYSARDMVAALTRLSRRAERGVLLTFAPRTPLLAVMHAVGRAFPRSDRAPAIEPVSTNVLAQLLAAEPQLAAWTVGRSKRISNGFYTSQAMELTRA
jgi:magnesium-protoporphyrin O-methyltransferase